MPRRDHGTKSVVRFCTRLAPGLLLTALLAACAAGPTGQAPPSGTRLPAAPATVAGDYSLTAIGGKTLPVTVADQNGCDTQIDGGELRLRREGTFELTRTRSRSCDGIVVARTVARGKGVYGGSAAALTLRADSGGLFRSAGATVEGTSLTLHPAKGNTAWTFERRR